ncbi:MAG: RNA polymerase sigma-70 factor [Bacteroidales bacterium]|nr:RNA polymerase sigma-70 factor [Bacteroidales bacterium]
MDDRKLIERLRTGDRKAYGELYVRHKDACINYARLLVGSSPADDIVQDVFVNLWKTRSLILDVESVRPYLLKAVYNSSLNYLRGETSKNDFKNRYARQIQLLTAATYEPGANPLIDKLFVRDARASIDEAISLLPNKCGDIFRMSYISGMSHREIAEKLHLQISTVDNQIYKALRFIRSYIPREFFNSILIVALMDILG